MESEGVSESNRVREEDIQMSIKRGRRGKEGKRTFRGQYQKWRNVFQWDR